MENKRKTIEIVFRRMPIKKIYDDLCSMTDFYHSDITRPNEYRYDHISEKAFLNASYNIFRNISNDEIKNIYHKFIEETRSENTSHIFNLLYKYGETVLTRSNTVPKCKYEHLLNWWKTSNKMGQDIITMSYMAKSNIIHNSDMISFTYPAVMGHDNNRLNAILDKGLAENHFHLNGSTATFPLSWAYLMNHYEKINRRTDKVFENILDKDIYGADNSINWSTFIKIAAIIRVWLFNKISIQNTEVTNMETSDNECIETYNSAEIVKYIRSEFRINPRLASAAIDRARYIYGVKDSKTGKVLDYASPMNISKQPIEMTLLTGERFFLYNCFKSVYLGQFNNIQMQMFYLYLAIKAYFRGEMIQSNDRIGFNNFSLYQDRKDVIFEGDKLYERCADKLAVNLTFKAQNIKFLEARIAPKSSSNLLIRSINKKDRHIMENNKMPLHEEHILNENDTVQINNENFFYVVHFIKKAEKNIKAASHNNTLSISCRNHECRRIVHKQAEAIFKALNEKNSLRNRIYGIDAASTEIGCRPEVMASEFRFLKNMITSYHHCKFINENTPHINATYHVGEDFYDIIDGLRAIDEAILFLDLKINDRLGHALALGTDPMCYYQKRNFTTVMPRQDMLDDLVWFIYKADSVNAELTTSDRRKLLNEINILYQMIYESGAIDICNYIHSWKLRGDNPELYRSGELNTGSVKFVSNQYKISCKNEAIDDKIRNNDDIVKIYSKYHFDINIREKGAEQTSFTFTKSMVNTLSQIQYSMQFEIASKNISIECNPTSNYVIGNFKRFDKHPMLLFYNKHLEHNELKTAQISVSINTDDQGIFDTNLKNEFSVMAASLEQVTNENDQQVYSPDSVYHWIDEVREMGIHQSFGIGRK